MDSSSHDSPNETLHQNLPNESLPNSDLPNQSSPNHGVPNNDSARRDLPINASQTHPMASPLVTDIVGSLQSLLGTIVIAVFVITFVVQAFQIPSQSMENTLLVGDYLLVNKLCYGGRGPGDHLMPYQKIQRGDIIVFHYPVDPTQHFVKRVIGMPGDRLRMINKKVWINGKPLDEPYVRFLEPPNGRDPSSLFRDNFPRLDVYAFNMEGKWWQEMRKLVEDDQLIIPAGHYFVMGDNRDDSQDSRYWGFVPQENIIGRPLLIYWSVKPVFMDPPPASIKGKISHFAYALTHLFEITRWNRTLRLIH
jgi:signal peptidase I